VKDRNVGAPLVGALQVCNKKSDVKFRLLWYDGEDYTADRATPEQTIS